KGGKKGKLMLLLQPVIQDQGGAAAFLQTGLEPLLAERGVQLGNNRVLTVQKDPRLIAAIPDPRSPNPVPQAFLSGQRVTMFTFQDARTVDPVAAGRNPPPGRAVDRLVAALPQYGIWAERSPSVNPSAKASAI